jgi:hypothetical protein
MESRYFKLFKELDGFHERTNDFLGGYLTFFKKLRIAVMYSSTFPILAVIKLFLLNTFLFQELVAHNARIF